MRASEGDYVKAAPEVVRGRILAQKDLTSESKAFLLASVHAFFCRAEAR